MVKVKKWHFEECWWLSQISSKRWFIKNQWKPTFASKHDLKVEPRWKDLSYCMTLTNISLARFPAAPCYQKNSHFQAILFISWNSWIYFALFNYIEVRELQYVQHKVYISYIPPVTTQTKCKSPPSSYGPARDWICSPRSLKILGGWGGTVRKKKREILSS